MAAERLYPRRHSARFWIILTAFLGGGPSIYLIGSGVTLIATRIAAMAFGCFAGFIAANQAPSAFDVVPASQRASTVGVLNLVGSTLSGFAPFLGGRARRTIGVGRLMAYTSGGYMATAGLPVYAIVRHFNGGLRQTEERS